MCSRRKPTWDDIFEKDFFEDPTLVRSSRPRGGFDISGDNAEAEPYHYGLVGGSHSPNSEYAGVPLHERKSSETPLISKRASSNALSPDSGAANNRSSYPSRPSTSGSMYPSAGPSSVGHGQLLSNNLNLAALPRGAGAPGFRPVSPAESIPPAIAGPSAPLIPSSPPLPPLPPRTSNEGSGSPTTPTSALPERRMLFVANQDPGSPTSVSFSLIDAEPESSSSPGPSALGFTPYPSAVSEKQRLKARNSVMSTTSIGSHVSAQTLSHPVLTPTTPRSFAVTQARPSSAAPESPLSSPTSPRRPESPPGAPQLPPITPSSPVLVHLDAGPIESDPSRNTPLRLDTNNSTGSGEVPPPAYAN